MEQCLFLCVCHKTILFHTTSIVIAGYLFTRSTTRWSFNGPKVYCSFVWTKKCDYDNGQYEKKSSSWCKWMLSVNWKYNPHLPFLSSLSPTSSPQCGPNFGFINFFPQHYILSLMIRKLGFSFNCVPGMWKIKKVWRRRIAFKHRGIVIRPLCGIHLGDQSWHVWKRRGQFFLLQKHWI